MDKETILLIINTAFALPAFILALSCLRLCYQMRPKKEKK